MGDGTDSDSEGSTGTTAGTNTTQTTTPMTTAMTSVATTDATGILDGPPDTSVGPDTATGPGDTTTGGTMTDGCCEAHSSPGCNEPAVVDCVCAQEASCCAFEWSQTCVDIAMGGDCMATCEVAGTTTTGEGTTTTGAMGGACTETITFEMQPSEATYDGGWALGMSMVGEGEISVYNFGDGSFTYSPDIPCDDTWYIWARVFDNGSQDSYFATIDGEPMPEAIFEGDCTNGGMGYHWAVFNWRDQAAMACNYVENPWAPDWTTGVHEIVLSFRESQAMGRILITNDQDYVPM